MKESGYYPLGAEFDPRAPWNEIEVPDRKFSVTCSQSLSKQVDVVTSNYTIQEDDQEQWIDTSGTNWNEEYHASKHYTPLELIGLFKKVLQNCLEIGCFYKSEKHTQHLMAECENWVEDDLEITE